MSLVSGPMELSGRGGGTGGVSDNRRAAPGSGLDRGGRDLAGRGGAAIRAGRPGGLLIVRGRRRSRLAPDVAHEGTLHCVGRPLGAGDHSGGGIGVRLKCTADPEAAQRITDTRNVSFRLSVTAVLVTTH